MLFGGFQKLTTLDYPGLVSALAFTQGCNFHCPYCHNAQLMPEAPLPGAAPAPDLDGILAFLRKRQGLLDGIAISGGEPCLQNGLEFLCREAKALGYKVKLDTNGSFPQVLERLLRGRLLNYAAVDVKTSPEAYAPALTADEKAGEKLRETLRLLAASAVPFETRTTCVEPFVTAETVPAMAAIVPKKAPWFFQRANLPEKAEGMRALAEAEITALLPRSHRKARLRP